MCKSCSTRTPLNWSTLYYQAAGWVGFLSELILRWKFWPKLLHFGWNFLGLPQYQLISRKMHEHFYWGRLAYLEILLFWLISQPYQTNPIFLTVCSLSESLALFSLVHSYFSSSFCEEKKPVEQRKVGYPGLLASYESKKSSNIWTF